MEDDIKEMSAKRKALVLMVALGMLCAAGLRAAETEGDDFALRRDAPVYMGPYEEGDLEELTVADFGEFGTQPQAPQDQYRQYKKMLEHPSPGVQVPYRLKIVDRDLALEDFLGFGVPQDVAEVRYSGYLDMVPDTENGHTVHYVFVYRRPLSHED